MNWTVLPEKVPAIAAVYAVIMDGVVVYIGESSNIRARINDHSFQVSRDEGWWKGMAFTTLVVKIRPCVCKLLAEALESKLIRRLCPAGNVRGNRNAKPIKVPRLNTRPNQMFCKFVDAMGGQANVAKLLDLSTSHISLLYNGKRRVTVDIAERIHIATQGRF